MAPEEETADEFSLMDIKKLIQNYPKRKVNLEFPHFSIFLLWLGRICKSPAFKEFYMILGEYNAEFYSKEENKVKGESAYDQWKKSATAFEARPLDSETLSRLKIFDDKNCKKFVEFYTSWCDMFRALSI